MSEHMTIAVTGATGFVGRNLVRELLSRGHHVRALCRDREKSLRVLPADRRVTPIFGHVHDARSPRELLAGTHACINLIGIIREQRSGTGAGGAQTFTAMHEEAPRVLTQACAALGVKRFVQMSALGVRPDGCAEYQRSKFAGEQIVRRSGLDWTIVRPGLIHGPGGELTGMIHRWCKGEVPPYFFVPFFTRTELHDEGVLAPRVASAIPRTAPVSVTDVARVLAQCLASPGSIGEIYNVVGSQELGFDRMLEAFRDHLPQTDPNLKILGVPGKPHAVMAKLAGMVGLGGWLPFDEGMPLMAQEDQSADLSKLRAHLGIEPEGFESALRGYAGTMR